jgi:hypothetical protein
MTRQSSRPRVPVSERAVTQRINRKLAASGEKLQKCRSDRWRHDVGDWYVIDVDRNLVLHKHVGLEELGRKLGVLHEYENLVADDE